MSQVLRIWETSAAMESVPKILKEWIDINSMIDEM